MAPDPPPDPPPDPDPDPAPARHRTHQFPGRPARIAPRLTADEKREIRAAADALGLTPAGFLAEAGLAAARGIRDAATLDPRRETLAGLQAELFAARTALARVGTNLNQAVTALHAGRPVHLWLARAAHACEQHMTRLDDLTTRVDRWLR